jgi:protein SCO1/2
LSSIAAQGGCRRHFAHLNPVAALRAVAWLVVAAWALMFSHSSSAAVIERTFLVRGEVTAPLQDDRIIVAHEPVPDYMPAMTMPFRVEPPDRADAAKLQPGDRIEFKFTVGDTSRAHDFRVLSTAGRRPAATLRAPRLKEGGLVPPFSLIDQNGQPFTEADLRGRRTVLTFIFTRCPVPEFCPRLSQHFAALQERLATAPAGPPVQLVSITLDPEFDTPAVLRAYAERYGADSARWRFCTGAPAQIKALTQSFAVHVEQNNGTLDHTLATALIAPDGKLKTLWRGNRWTVDEVLAALAQ